MQIFMKLSLKKIIIILTFVEKPWKYITHLKKIFDDLCIFVEKSENKLVHIQSSLMQSKDI